MVFSELVKSNYKDRSFNTSIGTVNIAKDRSLYNALRSRFYDLANESANKFKLSFESYKDITEVLDKGEDDFLKSISNIVTEIKNSFIDKEQYDWDDKKIYEYLNEKGAFGEFYNIYNSFYNEVAKTYNQYESEKQYRADRKDNRGRWQGATFGGNAIDAVSHQMDIAAMNAVSGAAHGLFNMVGNAVSKADAEAKLNNLFKSPELKQSLITGVYVSAFNIHYIYALMFNNDDISWDLPTDEEVEKADRMLENLTNGSISKDKDKEICLELLELNPYNLNLFEHILTKYGDSDGSLQALADYYHVELAKIKDKSAVSFLNSHKPSTEDQAKQLKDDLKKFCDDIHLPISDNLDSFKQINAILDDFDKQYRTVDNVLFETRERADEAKKELPLIKEFMKDVLPPTKDSLLDYEDNINAKKEEFDKKFKSGLKPKYINQMLTYLDQFDKQFCSTRLFNTVDKKQAGKDKALEFAKALKFTTLEEYEEDYKKFEEFLPKVGITINEATEATSYLLNEREKIASGKQRSKNLGLAKGDIVIPLAIFAVCAIIWIIGGVTSSSLLANISIVLFIVFIVSVVKLVKKIKSKK